MRFLEWMALATMCHWRLAVDSDLSWVRAAEPRKRQARPRLRYGALNPMRQWVPLQNGLLVEPPQRQRV